MTLAIIIPSCGHFDYVRRAVQSAIVNTRTGDGRRPLALLVDDASPELATSSALRLLMPDCRRLGERIVVHRFAENGGLLRSLNKGLELARRFGAKYTCCANSDLIFTPGWNLPLERALDTGYSLVGPITNTPGTEVSQCVTKWWPDYALSDDATELAQLAEGLRAQYGERVETATVNGFCLFAKTETWWRHAYDRDALQVFCPRNDYNSRGQPNPTPFMTLGEYELQRRWHAAGLKTGFCPASFVFHYRSVSRGDRHKKGLWLRRR